MREAEKKRLIELLKCAREEMSKMFREKIEECLAKKGSFNSKTDGDRQSIYEIEADYLLENGVIVPKFKAGDKVFVISGGSYFEGEVKGLMDASLIYAHKKHAYLIRPEGEYLMYADEKNIFISKAEAEYALKNRRSVSLINGHIEE